jgi:cell division protein FtsI (penicillin-binding protein 3)
VGGPDFTDLPGRKTPIRDVHPKKSYLTVGEIIKYSSNVGSAKIAQRLGKETFYTYFRAFGFGAKTRIELPGEQVGMLRNYTKWRDVEFATMAFGYGITVTPIQIAGAVAAFGNDGVYNPPRIVDEIVARDGRVLYRSTAEPRRVIKAQTALDMRKMMGSVFESGKMGGTAGSIIVPGFVCGGKTGTAHKWDPTAKKYSEHNYLSSFIGLVPIDNPRLAIVVLVDDPAGGDYYGGKVAGPVFAKVASESLRYLGVPGTSLQCGPPIPNAHLLEVLPPKTCTIPAVKPKPAPQPVSDGNSPNRHESPARH